MLEMFSRQLDKVIFSIFFSRPEECATNLHGAERGSMYVPMCEYMIIYGGLPMKSALNS